MAKFKQVPQNFLFRKLVGYWGNMVHNYREDCHDNNFFDVMRNGFDASICHHRIPARSAAVSSSYSGTKHGPSAS